MKLKLIKIDNILYWRDCNNNIWCKSLFTEIQASNMSESLNCCSDCENCQNCSFCKNCHNCIYCIMCQYCCNCTDCDFCYNCKNIKNEKHIEFSDGAV